MAELAVAIAAARREWAGQIAALIAEGDRDSPFPFAEIALEGPLEHWLDGHSASAAEDLYRADLAGERPRDAHAGQDARRARTARTCACATGRSRRRRRPARPGSRRRCSSAWCWPRRGSPPRLSGETPIVLLDEIAAHLDQSRREALFAILEELGCQAFMTGTDAGVFAATGAKTQQFRVEDGAARRRVAEMRRNPRHCAAQNIHLNSWQRGEIRPRRCYIQRVIHGPLPPVEPAAERVVGRLLNGPLNAPTSQRNNA